MAGPSASVNYRGVEKSAMLTRIVVAGVLGVLAAVVVVAFTAGHADTARLAFGDEVTVGGILQSAGLLFFAFAGYARIATLAEEIRDPAHTIPRAIPLALALTLAVYTVVAMAALAVLGPRQLAEATAPLTQTVHATGVTWLEPVVRAGAATGRRSARCSP